MPDEAWLVAVHESAHAVANLAWDIAVIEIWSDGVQGHCRLRGPGNVITSLAGHVAEWKIMRPDDVPTIYDFRDNSHIADVQRAVRSLGSTNCAVLRACWIEARTLVDREWAAILRVAVALQLRGRLTGDEVAALWREVQGRRVASPASVAVTARQQSSREESNAGS